MLRELHIENIAVIESVDLSFEKGFSVLTGETGAGKSILIDSIGMLLGARTTKDIVRTGCKKALVEASFDCTDELNRRLSENGIDSEEDIIIVSRELTADGRSTARINGRQITSSLLREIGALLINIHGQHDNIVLLDSSRHMAFLDAFANNEKQINEYADAYKNALNIKKQIGAISSNEKEKSDRIEFLKYQIDEIEAANLRENEDEELEKRRTILANNEKIIEHINKTCDLINNGDSNVNDLLSEAVAEVRAVGKYDETLLDISEKLEEVYDLFDDVSNRIIDYRESADYDIVELDTIEARLNLIHKLKHKYGDSISAILTYLEEAKKELDDIEFSDEKLEKLRIEFEKSKSILIRKAESLTESRKSASIELEKRICSELAFLNMPKVIFKVQITSKSFESNGADNIEFLISTNVGEEPKSLSKIASGGELARIMLAVKNVLNQNDVQTLIFDEVDTGVSGDAAQKIAVKLRQMSDFAQVIVVTHLPQIAAYADEHYKISKSSDSAHTYTHIEHLDTQGRVLELSRIMGGSEATQSMLNTASEMLEMNKRK